MATTASFLRDTLGNVQRQREEELDRQIPREDAQVTEGLKALLAINGGGIVSMLGFMQALLSKANAFTTFKYYGTNALLFFVLGIISAALVPAFRAIYINSLLFKWKYDWHWEICSYAFWLLSLIFFVAGVVFVGFGVQNGLP